MHPIDYRRGGVITLFVGVGIYLLGQASFGAFFAGIGLLVGAIGIGIMIAGYLYPNTSEELTNAVESSRKNKNASMKALLFKTGLTSHPLRRAVHHEKLSE